MIYSHFILYFATREAKCSRILSPTALLLNDIKGSLRDETKTESTAQHLSTPPLQRQRQRHHVGTERLGTAEQKLNGANY